MRYNKKYILFSKYFTSIICITCIFASSCSKEKDDFETAPDITLNKSTLILEKGKTERLIASFTPADTPNKGHTWNSSAPAIATVDETGNVTAVSLGESIITVTALDGGKTATCQITVTDKIVNVTGILLNETEATLVTGDKLQLETTIIPENATDKTVAWSSSDNKVASVSDLGVITAISEGKATVTATTTDGEKSASCKINVRGKGVEISKPEVSDITAISAYMTGTIQAFGTKIQERGICYSTSQSPTVDNQKIVLPTNEISYTLTGLEPNTIYYVRIYAIIVDGTVKYGDQAMFTTEVPVEISEPQISSISTTTAYIEGTIKTFGLQTDETGICYSTSSMPNIEGTKVILSNTNIAYTLNELSPKTTYYVRIYAIIKGEIHYGEQGAFTTTGIIKTHFEPTDIYEHQIKMVSPAISGIKTVDICYGTSSHPKITDNVTTATQESDGKLHLVLDKLSSGANYYIRSYSRTGSKIEYHDDEVVVQTVGTDFRVQYNAHSYTHETNNGYVIEFGVTCNIKPAGTYLVESTMDKDAFRKNTDFAKSIYVESGKSSFTYKMGGGYKIISSRVEFNNRNIKFTNLDSNINYYTSVGQPVWDFSLWVDY